jgi:hypothetical protein
MGLGPWTSITEAEYAEMEAEIERLRTALADADKAMAEITKNDEEGEFTLNYRATRAAEIAHIWRVRHCIQ